MKKKFTQLMPSEKNKYIKYLEGRIKKLEDHLSMQHSCEECGVYIQVEDSEDEKICELCRIRGDL